MSTPSTEQLRSELHAYKSQCERMREERILQTIETTKERQQLESERTRFQTILANQQHAFNEERLARETRIQQYKKEMKRREQIDDELRTELARQLRHLFHNPSDLTTKEDEYIADEWIPDITKKLRRIYNEPRVTIVQQTHDQDPNLLIIGTYHPGKDGGYILGDDNVKYTFHDVLAYL